MLCNFPSSNPGGLAREVADVWLAGSFGEERTAGAEADAAAEAAAAEPAEADSAWVALPREHLETLVGLYREDGGPQVRRIRLEGVTLKIAVGPGYPLRPLGEDRFEVVGAGVTVELRPPREDQPAALRMPDGDTYRWIPDWDPGEEELADFVGADHSE